MTAGEVTLDYGEGRTWSAKVVAPAISDTSVPVPCVIESGAHYAWHWLLVPDAQWPRIIEVQADSLGTIAIRAYIQRLGTGDDYAPELGWRVEGAAVQNVERHDFKEGGSIGIGSADGAFQFSFPQAPLLKRGFVKAATESGMGAVTYVRCLPEEKVPFQESAWRTAAVVVGKAGHTPRSALLEPEVPVKLDTEILPTVYGVDPLPTLAMWPVLDDLVAFTREAITQSAVQGDDYGNVTSFAPKAQPSIFGMNRLNHCPAIFEEAYRAGDQRLRDTAVAWCANMVDLSIWWGNKEDFGGTRYNNAAAADTSFKADPGFMWRTNYASNFCTKGYDSFFYAYEETGDPRFVTALDAQVEYARKYVHTDQGECRNIGDAVDFMRLYQFTGVQLYRDEALRLFRELRTKLSEGDLFSQGGQPIESELPFINEDKAGYNHPFAKPYIIGYALSGLPALLGDVPEEPKLRDVIRAVADFLASAEDSVGGWRYPHPRSSTTLISQGIEHAVQLTRAASVLEKNGEPINGLLDAIERVLQARVKGFERSGAVLAGLSGWEEGTDLLKDGKTINDLYERPESRDRTRDYTEGRVSVGGAPPEGLVYLSEVLGFYLSHRPAERLFHANEQLGQVLERVADQRLKLTPLEKGSYLRIERPENPEIGVTLWAPEWATFPPLSYAEDQLGGMAIAWNRDPQTGGLSYTLDREEATFTADFVPHIDYVECRYTAWPKATVQAPASLGVGPCQQMKSGIFDGDDQELMTRFWFLSEGTWTTLASCANGNARNVLYVKGSDSPEMTGDMAAGGWKTIQDKRPDVPLIACVSQDGKWVGASAAEFSNCLCNNANASHRCMHSQGSMPLNATGPTTLRVHSYLLDGSLQDLKRTYFRHTKRWREAPASTGQGAARTAEYGVRDMLPSFNDARVRRMDFPLAWENAKSSFPEWRANARDAFLESLGPRPPLAPFDVRVTASIDRGTYVAQKLAMNISSDERVKAYLLIPKGPGPFPGIIALHDHGAHFSIGKEKVIQPFDEPEERLADSTKWVEECYGGKYIGDELASRGYVVFATDALFWGDRGRYGGVEYEDQQALASNMFLLGLSWSGQIVWDDVRSAEYVQGLSCVDPERIGCLGLSMGAHRTWSLAAATDIVKAGAAICWMGDTKALTSPGNNQTKGYSAYSMVVPGLRGVLDYSDVASIACPKPMMFFNGLQDTLFPVAGVEAAYTKMRAVWDSQGAGDRLIAKLWDVPHVFNQAMQDEAFAWLDAQFKP
ncbi:MAG: dienelactone hydrolase family protein [Candidatus Hydrogenedentales bacterium]|jgi:dienelactone hydrolase